MRRTLLTGDKSQYGSINEAKRSTTAPAPSASSSSSSSRRPTLQTFDHRYLDNMSPDVRKHITGMLDAKSLGRLKTTAARYNTEAKEIYRKRYAASTYNYVLSCIGSCGTGECLCTTSRKKGGYNQRGDRFYRHCINDAFGGGNMDKTGFDLDLVRAPHLKDDCTSNWGDICGNMFCCKGGCCGSIKGTCQLAINILPTLFGASAYAVGAVRDNCCGKEVVAITPPQSIPTIVNSNNDDEEEETPAPTSQVMK